MTNHSTSADASQSVTYPERTELPQVKIYADGSCMPNPGVGSWGAVLIHVASGKQRCECGYIGDATNNTAELIAAIEALKFLKIPCWVQLHSDSQWLILGANGTNKRRKYHDLWQQLDELAQPHLIEWVWVKGHDLNPDNERAHQLAEQGRNRRRS